LRGKWCGEGGLLCGSQEPDWDEVEHEEKGEMTKQREAGDIGGCVGWLGFSLLT
jgi:hypothetical protein